MRINPNGNGTMTVYQDTRCGELTTTVQRTVPEIGTDLTILSAELVKEGKEKISWGDREIVTTTDLLDKFFLECIKTPNKIKRSPRRIEDFLYTRSFFPELENLALSDIQTLSDATNKAFAKDPSRRNLWVGYIRSAAKKNGFKDIFETISLIPLDDNEFLIWTKNRDYILNMLIDPLFKTLIKLSSQVPQFEIRTAISFSKAGMSRIGRLVYFGSGPYDFFALPDSIDDNEMDLFINSAISYLEKNSLENLSQAWNQTCDSIGIKISLLSLHRFAIKSLLSEGFPRNLLAGSKTPLMGGWKSNCIIKFYNTEYDENSFNIWRKCIYHLNHKFKNRLPGLDAYAIKMALFNRCSNTLDMVPDLQNAIAIASLFVLRNCKSFTRIANTEIRLGLIKKNLQEFRPIHFGLPEN
jgi:hypothetical protein